MCRESSRKMANQTVSAGINIETKGGRDEDCGGMSESMKGGGEEDENY